MARAFEQSQPIEYERDGGDWQSLRHELVALLDEVDSRAANHRRPAAAAAPAREADGRRRDALRSVQRQLSRFEDPGQLPPNPRDSLEAAISQIRSRQGESRPATPPRSAPAPAPAARDDGGAMDSLAHSVNGLSGRLERLETEIRNQVKAGGDVKDVAEQVAQLAHVVELLAGAVGETGQVKRLEGQIASLGRIISQGREIDIGTLQRRLDDMAGTIGKLAELQVHYADKVENPVANQAFRDGMRGIEESVRGVYDRIDALERHGSLTPEDLDHVTAEMARFTEAVREHSGAPQGLVELIDALNLRIADIENGDRLLHGLRKDLGALREAVVVSLAPRFDAIEQRMDALSTREDMAEIGRQIGALGDRISEQPVEGVGQLEAQVRHLVARMDQTGEQLAGLARLYTEPALPDFDAMADRVAERAAAAVEKSTPNALSQTLAALEARISGMLETLPHDREIADVGSMQAGISEVNDRLRRLEASLSARASAAAQGAEAEAEVASDRGAPSGIEAIIAEAERSRPARRDTMPRSPADDAPLVAPAYPEPAGPVHEALELKSPRKLHPGLDDDTSLAARHEPQHRPSGVAPGASGIKVELPPAPRPSAGFGADLPAPVGRPPAEELPEAGAVSTNTFIAAARRAAQRQMAAPTPEPASTSLISRALSRLHASPSEPGHGAAAPAAAAAPKSKGKAASTKPADDAQAAPAVSIEPQIMDAGADEPNTKPGFLARHRRTILFTAAIALIALLATNLVIQRLGQPDQPADSTPTTTGDIAPPPAVGDEADAFATSMPARVIAPDEGTTGSIGTGISPAFIDSPVQALPSTFAAPSTEDATAEVPDGDAIDDPEATDGDGNDAETTVANIDPSTPAPLAPSAASGTALPLPPDKIGPVELRQAAAGGDARAQFEVGTIFTEGRAVPQDYAAAATWYQHAAEAGFVPAEYRLGSLYESGKGVTKNLKTAELWYEKAAEAGNRMSMHNLASLYAGGQMGTQQFDKAALWFEKAANLGLVDSQFNLGMLYARGLGVTQSLENSFRWFGIAALSGDKDAAKARDDIARSLDAATVARLTTEVNAFRPGSIDIAANFAPIGTWSQSFDPGATINSRDIVESVQKALAKLGYDVGTPDGIAGPKTADAIKSFEGAAGMSQVGQINPRLLAVLGSQPV